MSSCASDVATLQQRVFLSSCALQGCHGSDSPAAALDLESGDVAARLVGVPSSACDGKIRVVAGAPEASFLYEKVTAVQPACGEPMPVAGALSADDVACIKQWIAGLPPSDGGVIVGGCETCGGSACVDLKSDPSRCGGCATACPPGGSCAAGACACGAGLTTCGAKCTDTQSDPANCGGCGKACPTGAGCSAGECVCPGGTSACDSACVDLSSDPANCGGCGKPCAGAEVCKLEVCSASCGGLTQCGAACVDTSTSEANCGGCGKACPAGASCVGGMCQCPAGTSSCNGQCINTATDPANCGGCGQVCGQGTTCQASMCACPGGGAVCGGSCVDITTDPNNCGSCGNACAAGQTCSSSACACGSASVSFSAAVQPIFTASCAQGGCHGGPMPQQGLNLTAGKAHQALVNVAASECNDGRKRVLPGQPQQSYVIDKVMGVDLCSGTKMPKLSMLPASEIQMIADWICEGAPNN